MLSIGNYGVPVIVLAFIGYVVLSQNFLVKVDSLCGKYVGCLRLYLQQG